jgi:membrane protein required for colicin V production
MIYRNARGEPLSRDKRLPPGLQIVQIRMNPFDAAVLGLTLIAVATGFSAGLLRGLATILAYVIAAPVALAAAPTVTAMLTGRGLLPIDGMPNSVSYVPLVLVIVIGMVLGALMRGAVGATAGRMGIIDRVLGAVLGALRIGFVAVLLVMIFERIIPPGSEPDWFSQSQLRPYLSAASAQGLRALPPQVAETIDRFKREHGL